MFHAHQLLAKVVLIRERQAEVISQLLHLPVDHEVGFPCGSTHFRPHREAEFEATVLWSVETIFARCPTAG